MRGNAEDGLATRPSRPTVWGCWRVLVAMACVLFGTAAPAHDIPSDVVVQAWVHAEGPVLRVLLRVPLAAMREVDVPLRPGGTIDLERAEPALREAARLWLIQPLALYEGGRPLPPPTVAQLRISLPSDRSYTSYEQALAHLAGPRIPVNEQLYWNQQLLDVQLETPLPAPASADTRIAIEPRYARLGLKVTMALRYRPPGGGAERVFELHGDPGIVPLTPGWAEAAWRFVQLGVEHILDGTDHLLFLACLVIPLRRLRPLVVVATAFTVAHTLTLVATALGLGPQGLWFPPFVETLIAASIVWMALANVLGVATHHRWAWAFGFGLVHGFGFAYALRESLQFAGDHLVSSLLAFNVGVELGQVAVLVVLVPLVSLLVRRLPERPAVIVLSALAAHTAWHWLQERGEAWWKHPLPRLEQLGPAEWAQALGWLTAALVVGAALWSARAAIDRWTR
jgi:hypothetical protein